MWLQRLMTSDVRLNNTPYSDLSDGDCHRDPDQPRSPTRLALTTTPAREPQSPTRRQTERVPNVDRTACGTQDTAAAGISKQVKPAAISWPVALVRPAKMNDADTLCNTKRDSPTATSA